MDDFPQKLKKVVRIVLYGPVISQSDCRKTGLYQLPSNNISLITTGWTVYTEKYKARDPDV